MPENNEKIVINEILPFASAGTVQSGDVMELADYKQDIQRLRGHQPGIARRELENTALRQASHMAVGLAEFIAREYVAGVKDDGDAEKIVEGLIYVVEQMILEKAPLPPKATTTKEGLAPRLATDDEVKGASGIGLVSAEQLGFLGNSLVYPSAFHSFYEQTPPPGWKVRNGAVLANADVAFPELWEALQEPRNAWKCKTLAQWTALSTAAEGVGGVPFFVLDKTAKTIKLPDTRGDYERGAGSSYLSTVGNWHGDAIRNITGSIQEVCDSRNGLYGSWKIGRSSQRTTLDNTSSGSYYKCSVSFSAATQVPTAEENRPRSFGTLPCVYVGGI